MNTPRPLSPLAADPVADGLPVFDRHYARILQALAGRSRYRYVQPRVLRHGQGWRILSPNCSRNVHPLGGEIAIAWLQPAAEQGPADAEAGDAPPAADPQPAWRLHRWHHAGQRWLLQADGLPLEQALAQLCSDPDRVFWP